MRRGAAALAATLLFAGCTTTPDPAPPAEPDRTVAPATPPTEVDTSALRVPVQVDDVRVVDPGWDTEPRTLDGTTLGFAATDGVLRFTAVDADGTARWSTERPATCTGHALTRTPDGRALAVLTDTDGDTLTAAALDLRTGARVWGPVEVPGPHQGPGLVFAAPAGTVVGDAGPQVVLDAATGREVTATDVLGEHDGTLLTRDGDDVVATRGDVERWRTDLPVLGPSTAAAPPGTARLRADDGDVLVDLESGTVLADGLTDVVVDPTTGTVVTVEDATLRGTAVDGTELWASSTAPGTTAEAAVGALVYLRDGETLRAHNVVTGALAEAYDPAGTGEILVPVLPTAAGAVVLTGPDGYLLATTTVVDRPDE